MSPNSIILNHIHAQADESMSESFDKIERELELENQLKSERAAHEKTRAALAAQTTAAQRLNQERQIEQLLQSESKLTTKAVATVTQLLLKGDGGELEVDGKGKLREKFGTRSLEELAQDYLKINPHFSGGEDSAISAAPKLYKAEMSAKQIADFINAQGRDAFHALPRSKPEKK